MAQDPPLEATLSTLGLQDIPACVDLIRAGFEEFGDRSAEVARWFEARIVSNPWQRHLPGIGVGLRDDTGWVAFRAMFAQPWWLQGKPTVVAFAAHTAVDARFRGQGLGTKLIQASCAFAPITGSTSAGSITQKAYRKLNFDAIGGDDNGFFRIRTSHRGSIARRLGSAVGRPVGHLLDLRLVLRDRRLGSTVGYTLESPGHCDAEFDRLWERCREGQSSCLERSSRYLNWRLFEHPTHPLKLSALRNRAGHLQAIAIWSTLRYSEFVETAVLRDLLWPSGDEETLQRLLRLLFGQWREAGIAWANLEVTSGALLRLFGGAGYASVPSNGNRYWIHCDPPIERHVLDDWFRSGLDGDYFDVQP